MVKMKIDILINYKDRPTELGLLLQSLRTQTYQEFDVYILDCCSGTPPETYYFVQCLIQRMKFEQHNLEIIHADKSRGVAMDRQMLVDYVLKNGTGDLFCRLDDDVILNPNYLAFLYKGIIRGYDLMSGVTPPILNPETPRDMKFILPIINRVVLNADGTFLINCDDCGQTYIGSDILPTDHFRSCALIKREVHETVKYEETLTPSGFREEQFFSFHAILKGYKLGVDTGAVAWHLCTPSGGDRRTNKDELNKQNQILLNRWTKRMYQKHGDFIEDYHERLGIKETEQDKLRSLYKNTNLIYCNEL